MIMPSSGGSSDPHEVGEKIIGKWGYKAIEVAPELLKAIGDFMSQENADDTDTLAFMSVLPAAVSEVFMCSFLAYLKDNSKTKDAAEALMARWLRLTEEAMGQLWGYFETLTPEEASEGTLDELVEKSIKSSSKKSEGSGWEVNGG
jgi:hypothetical protein